MNDKYLCLLAHQIATFYTALLEEGTPIEFATAMCIAYSNQVLLLASCSEEGIHER